MSTKVNYIVANYIGPMRTYSNYQNIFNRDPLHFLKKHLNFIQTAKIDDLVATFVFNDDIDDEIKKAILLLATNSNAEMIFRKNSGFSYGIWNDIIVDHINDYDYFFLIEDDYLPSKKDFLQHFIKRTSDSVAFVCGMIEEASNKRYPDRVSADQEPFCFPSISNGLITAESCKKILENHDSVFKINLNNDYSSAYNNQIYFCKYFTDLGFKLTDILDEFSSPYYDATRKCIKVYGHNKESLLEPIIV